MNSKIIRIPGLNQKCRSKTLTHMRFYWQRTLKDNHDKDLERQLKRVCKWPTARKRRQHVWETPLTSPSPNRRGEIKNKSPSDQDFKIGSLETLQMIVSPSPRQSSIYVTVVGLKLLKDFEKVGVKTIEEPNKLKQLPFNSILKLCTLTGYK